MWFTGSGQLGRKTERLELMRSNTSAANGIGLYEYTAAGLKYD